MITRTLFCCVLIALSPGESAEIPKIDVNCNVNGDGDFSGVTDTLLTAFSYIPEVDFIYGIAKDIIGIYKGMADGKDDGLDKQWEKCIKGWIDKKIEANDLRETQEIMLQMATKMNQTLIPSLNDTHMSDYDFWQLNYNIQDLEDSSGDIRVKASDPENKDPSSFLIAYDGALAYELTSKYLFISKLNSSYDQIKLPGILHDIGDAYKKRMNILNLDLEHIEKDTLKGYLNNWEDKIKVHGPTSTSCSCTVEDPTKRTYVEKCYECSGGCLHLFGCSKCHDCRCTSDKRKAINQAKQIKNNIRNLLGGMNKAVKEAYN